ncbi:MAG: host-nuclease inhibitor Gam family protein [Candidatus Moraniibacteriota bacterium]
MVKTITRIKKSKTVVPHSITEADVVLGQLGDSQNKINAIEKELKERIAELKLAATKKLRPLVVERDAKINSLFAFANPRKAQLTKELRTIALNSGIFGWRLTPPRVETKLTDEEVIALLKETGNDDFIRIIEEVDRQALLAERPVIEGITYAQDDEFFVVPKLENKKKKTFTHAIDRC